MKKILVVDDDENNVSYLETLFRAQGFHVTTADNGAKALDSRKKRSSRYHHFRYSHAGNGWLYALPAVEK